MDGSRFDAWVRAWGTSSRRGVVRLLGAAGAVGLIAGLGTHEASAKCVNPGKKCKKKNGKKKKCCGGAKCKGKKCKCTTGGVECGPNCCIPGQLCQSVNGVLSCVNGQVPNGGACDPTVPGACTSGVCGCSGGDCVCRNSSCRETGGVCTGDLDCCQGACDIGNSFTCSG